MDTQRLAKPWHTFTAVLTWAALLLQLVLVVRGGVVLDEVNPPALGTRLIRFISYFTILTNLLVAITTTTLVLGQTAAPRWWKVLRLNAIVGIAVTGLIHWFFLRPLLDLSGADYLADKLLHVVVPLVAVIGWAVFGPRDKVEASLLVPSLIYPIGWLVYTLVRGAIVDWYPYPFLDVGLHGYPRALLACAGVAVLLLALTWGAMKLDPRLPGVRDHTDERRAASAR
ncbi:Integral membrane protein [Janibacter sp. HTCC2649]|uniref:Pr6Pr family membrane protein n=1 Tax=Janibacter sp. HTCC2649 TaxID=313589 RepID=UPI00006709FB|nr:Pr6Pr family membrane protein [Janibacter sp. HTCC2649]EAP99821.1 Integral membrane protein [Janibacter sp. HTCC2649]